MIQDYEKQYISARKQVMESKISERNKELILGFVDELVLEGLSKSLLMKYCNTLKIIAIKMGKDLDKATITDVKKFIAYIQNQDYSPWTRKCYRVIVRRFYE